MSITIVDALIVIIILIGGIVGYKNGAIKEGIKFIGIAVILVVSFLLKDGLMVIMYENLPFFDFFGIIKGISSVNILFYQLLSFLIIFAALTFILRVVLVVTGLVEWLLKMTVFLKGISKILGIFVGIIEFYVYVFIVLLILNAPVLNLTYVENSQFSNFILNNTPILSSITDNTVNAYSDVWKILKNKKNKSNDEVNTEVLITLLDNKLLTIDSAKKLVESNKIILSDENILNNYQTNNNTTNSEVNY